MEKIPLNSTNTEECRMPNLLIFCPRCENGDIILEHKTQKNFYEGSCENCKEVLIAKVSK